MKFILADTELQLIPPEMQRDKNVIKLCEKEGKEPSRCLLNYSIHKEFIKRYYPNEAIRMGRIYIPYIFTRMNQESILNYNGSLDYAIHTKEGYILEKKDISKLESYEDFLAGIEELLINGEKKDINRYIDEQGYKSVIVFHPSGTNVLEVPKDSLFIIGGFPEGDYHSDFSRFKKVSLFDRELTVPAVLEIIHSFIIFSGENPYISFSSL